MWTFGSKALETISTRFLTNPVILPSSSTHGTITEGYKLYPCHFDTSVTKPGYFACTAAPVVNGNNNTLPSGHLWSLDCHGLALSSGLAADGQEGNELTKWPCQAFLGSYIWIFKLYIFNTFPFLSQECNNGMTLSWLNQVPNALVMTYFI